MSDNGQTAPGWVNADPRAVIGLLTTQIAGLVQQLAMRDAYIDQLHQALAEANTPEPVPD